jgi:hypothetical protein
VNRAAGATIQVVVDDIAKEVKIAVPLDGATTPSHVLTMSYFNGWQDPLMLTLSGERVANRQSRRWNIDPIPTGCMAMVQRTLLTPVDQRVNYHQLLLGVPTTLAASLGTIVAASIPSVAVPAIVPGTYYAQLAKVTGGQETAYSPILGPFTVSITGTGPFTLETLQVQLPGDGLEDSWTLYFGQTFKTNLSLKVSIPNNVKTYNLLTNGVPAVQPAGFLGLQYMEPGQYNDLGAGYNARYRPAYAKEAPSQEWPDGERLLRFSAFTGRAIGSGNMLVTAITPDPNYEPPVSTQSLDEGEARGSGQRSSDVLRRFTERRCRIPNLRILEWRDP